MATDNLRATQDALRDQQARLRTRVPTSLRTQQQARRMGVSPQYLQSKQDYDKRLSQASNSPIVKSFESKVNKEQDALNKLQNEIQSAIKERDKLRQEASQPGLAKHLRGDKLDRSNALNAKASRLSQFLPQLKSNVESLKGSKESIRNLVFAGQENTAKEYVSSVQNTPISQILNFGNRVYQADLRNERKERSVSEAVSDFQRVTGRSLMMGGQFTGVSREEFNKLSRQTRNVLFKRANFPQSQASVSVPSRANVLVNQPTKVEQGLNMSLLGNRNVNPNQYQNLNYMSSTYNKNSGNKISNNLNKLFGFSFNGNVKKNDKVNSKAYEKQISKVFSL